LDQGELEAVETRRRAWQAMAVVTTAGLVVLAVPGTRRVVRGPTTIAPMAAVVAGATLAALAAWGNTRLTLAGQPLLACAAAAFLADRAPIAGRVGRGQPGSDPTTETNETISPGWPPRLCVSARLRSATVVIWRSCGASPRSCSQHSNSMRDPDAPTGCPKLFSPPSGF